MQRELLTSIMVKTECYGGMQSDEDLRIRLYSVVMSIML